ncbi:MAG TPA: AlpA family transcriptional regulator [Candidatus Omnitrophica bacterium]|nr:AlpA family transcriptional regulator [Candidatus Omnitrophota bacterium]
MIWNTNDALGRYLRPREVCAILSISLPTLWRLRKRGDLPPATRVSPGCIAWREDVIADYLRSRSESNLR